LFKGQILLTRTGAKKNARRSTAEEKGRQKNTFALSQRLPSGSTPSKGATEKGATGGEKYDRVYAQLRGFQTVFYKQLSGNIRTEIGSRGHFPTQVDQKRGDQRMWQ